MNLEKNDPVYYKMQLKKLLSQAKKNGLKISLEDNSVCFIREIKVQNVAYLNEQASVNIKSFEE